MYKKLAHLLKESKKEQLRHYRNSIKILRELKKKFMNMEMNFNQVEEAAVIRFQAIVTIQETAKEIPHMTTSTSI